MRTLLNNIVIFYRHDCCWPYSAAFYVTLLVYWQDFFIVKTPSHWASLLAYGILVLYFIDIARLYFGNAITTKRNLRFFMLFLLFKVLVLGGVLAGLHLIAR